MLGRKWKRVQGILLPLDWELGFHTLRWIVNGKYESGEIQIIRHTLSPEDKVLEIGAGLGFITSFCSLITGSDKVASYEANPLNAEMAQRVYQKNQVTPTLRNAMLGQEAGFVTFPVNRRKRLASSVLQKSADQMEVPVEQLNEVVKQLQPTYLVMDIEGAEYDIIRILEPLTIKKIQFELHPELLGDAACNELFLLLERHGFERDRQISHHPNYFYQRI